MVECERRDVPYLFKLRHTKKVKVLVKQMMAQGADWQDCGDGWESIEARLRLGGHPRPSIAYERALDGMGVGPGTHHRCRR